jgi:hypothetical protein
MNRKLRSFVFSLGIGLGCSSALSCSSALVTSARQDDLKTFDGKLQSAPKPLTNAALVEIARAVAERELLSMPANAAVSRVTELDPCVAELETTFQQLSRREGVVGAVATQVLLDAGLWKGNRDDLIERYASSAQPEWRAAAARAAVGAEQAPYRRKMFLDGDLRVRRAALRAARDARAIDDRDALLEAARLDPDPVARTFALEAISVIADEATLARLRDVWQYADEAGRREIVLAWSRKAALANGGRAQLGWVLTSQSGIPQLAAAVVLLERGEDSGLFGNPDAVAAEGVLVRGFTDGTTEEQQFVTQYGPRTPTLVAAFVQALGSDDEQRAVAAASVLVKGTTWRKAAAQRLTALLNSKTPLVAAQAGDVLAAERAPHMKDQLRKRLSAAQPDTRVAAATQLLAYHRAGQTGLGFEQLLADPVASVRTRLACGVIDQLQH